MLNNVVVCAALFSIMACENDVPPISIDEARETTPFSETKNFRYIALGNVPNSRLTEIMSGLEDKRPNVLEFFGVSEMPVVTVMIWQSRSDFERAYGENNPSVRGFIGADITDPDIIQKILDHIRGPSRSQPPPIKPATAIQS